MGIAGLTLGGGMNDLMANYGAVCDNVVSAQVITCDGRILTANAQENPDLYWGIRGGGGNLGIVTRFDYRLHPLADVLVAHLSFALARASDALKVYRDLLREAPDELQTSAGFAPAAQSRILLLMITYCGESTAGRKLVDRWRSLLRPDSANIRSVPYATHFEWQSSAVAATGVCLPRLTDDAIAVLIAHAEAAPTSFVAAWNDLHGKVTRISAREAAFPLREAGLDFFFGASWTKPSEKAQAQQRVSGFLDALRPHGRGVYVNNLSDEGPERAREAYGASYARLAQIKAKYDPQNVFHLNHNVAPASGGV